MKPPPVFPLRPVARVGLFRQTPPMIFLPLMGLFALGLAWRKGHGLFGVSAGVVEMFLGGVTLLWAFAVVAYAVKVLRRPGVLREEVATLPGRIGVSATVLTIYLFAVVLAPYSRPVALAVLFGGFALHVALAGLLLAAMRDGPPEARGVSPVWQLSFTGFVVGGLGAGALGQSGLAVGLVLAAIPVAIVIWGLSLWQFANRVPPAPLRPLLALHLAPAGLLTTISAAQNHPGLATGFALVSTGLLVVLAVSARWLTATGFSAFWAAFTFPLASCATALLTLGGVWTVPGALVLVAATLIVPPVAYKVMQGWADGKLAGRSNAAVA